METASTELHLHLIDLLCVLRHVEGTFSHRAPERETAAWASAAPLYCTLGPAPRTSHGPGATLENVRHVGKQLSSKKKAPMIGLKGPPR